MAEPVGLDVAGCSQLRLVMGAVVWAFYLYKTWAPLGGIGGKLCG